MIFCDVIPRLFLSVRRRSHNVLDLGARDESCHLVADAGDVVTAINNMGHPCLAHGMNLLQIGRYVLRQIFPSGLSS